MADRWGKFLSRISGRNLLLRQVRDFRRLMFAMEGKIRDMENLQRLEFFEITAVNHPRYGDPRRLFRHGRQTYSQHDEDGMISEIFRRIGTTNRTFVEIGVGDGLENNTTLLLTQGWNGFWIDGDPELVSAIKGTFQKPIQNRKLTIETAMLTAENVAGTLRRIGVPRDFDLFSLDIDRNTYWLWAAMAEFKPRVVVVEFNSQFPPEMDWKVDYHPDLTWKGGSYFGASLKAFELLGRQFGYSLVGCDWYGVNAFFVLDELCGDHFAPPFTSENHYEPTRFGRLERLGHPPAFKDYDAWPK